MRGVLLALSYTLPYRGIGICGGWDALGCDAQCNSAIQQTAILRCERRVPRRSGDLE